MAVTKLVLLPGMDGTGELFADFIQTLPDSLQVETVRYPVRGDFSDSDRMALLQAAVPATEPFVLLAESYSTPLAIQYAAMRQPHLKGLILCAGFAASPVRGWRRRLCWLVAPVAFRVAIPGFLLRHFLVGRDASPSLMAGVRAAISSVEPRVLGARLREILACDVREELSRVAVPMLYIEALQDRLVPASCCEEIRRIRPRMVVEAMDGPHLILQCEPGRGAALVVEFMGRL